MGLTVTEDTPADMLAGNMELLVQLPPRIDEDYENDDIYVGDDVDHVHQHHRNHHRHHNHHHNNGHHQRRTVNGNARRVTVARSTPMMDLLVQVATSQKLSASSYTLEAIGEHGLVLTHHPNTPIGALDALQVKLLPKQGTFLPVKSRHVNQPFEQTFRLQVHLPRNQLYVSRVSSRMNLGKILDDVCREKNLDPNNYELCHPANIEETLDLSLSLQDYHLQEVTLCPKRRGLGSSLSSQDIMALQRQEERRRQEAKQSVFGFAFKKSKESSLSTDSLGERSVSPARSDGTGRSASPQATSAPPTRPQRKRRPAPKPPMSRVESEIKREDNATKENESEKDNGERIIVISHSRNSSDSSGYHEASVLSDNLDGNSRVPETLPRRSKLQPTPQESPSRTLAESSQASKSLGNLAVVPMQRTSIARGTSNSSLMSAGLRKKKAAPAPPPPRPLSSAISAQALERIVDSEESLPSVSRSFTTKASSDVAVETKRESSMSSESDDQASGATPKNEVQEIVKTEERIAWRDSSRQNIQETKPHSIDSSISSPDQSLEEIPIVPNVETARERKRVNGATPPVPKPRASIGRLEIIASEYSPKNEQIIERSENTQIPSQAPKNLARHGVGNFEHLESIPKIIKSKDNVGGSFLGRNVEQEYHRYCAKSNNSDDESPRPMPRGKNDRKNHSSDRVGDKNTNLIKNSEENLPATISLGTATSLGDYEDVETEHHDPMLIKPKKPRRKTLEKQGAPIEENGESEENYVDRGIIDDERKTVELLGKDDETPDKIEKKIVEATLQREEKLAEEIQPGTTTEMKNMIAEGEKRTRKKWQFVNKMDPDVRRDGPMSPVAPIRAKKESIPINQKDFTAKTKYGHISDEKRSCAVISTIPKCDNFQSPLSATRRILKVGENEGRRNGDKVADCNLMTKMDSSVLGASFGAGKPVFDTNYQRDFETNGASSMTSKSYVPNSGTDDELELESFEMFEQSRNPPKASNLLRSHSELNDFEINTFEGNGKRLTSQSVDFTFALNPNLSRNISDLSTHARSEKNHRRQLNLGKSPQPGNKSPNLQHPKTKIPAFIATSITWEKQELLLDEEDDRDPKKKASSAWESGSGDDEATLSTVQITKGEEATSDLLKKVSDTLSGSLRSPTSVAEAVASTDSSLAKEQQSNLYSADKSEPGDAEPRVNEAEILSEIVNENLRSTGGIAENERSPIDPIADSNFHDNRSKKITERKKAEAESESECGYSPAGPTTSDSMQNKIISNISPTSTDWEYVLPEPPTAFRDTNVQVDYNRQVFTSVSSSKTISSVDQDNVPKFNADVIFTEKPHSRSNETVKSRDPEIHTTNGSKTTSLERKISNGPGIRSRTISNSSEIGSDLMAIDKGRLSRAVVKSSVDSDSRRGSLASSTPSIAPVDNTLSNFVITTYTRPKNVDIFDEIEERKREPEANASRKNSTANSGHSGGNLNPDSRKCSTTTVSLNRDINPQTEGKLNAGVFSRQEKSAAQRKVNGESQETGKIENFESIGVLNEIVNRSNIKISIATKPRPRGDSVNEKECPKSVFPDIGGNDLANSIADNNSSRDYVPADPTAGNKIFSQWRENVSNKQERNPTADKQLQSLQVLRGILPQLDDSQGNSEDSTVCNEKGNSNSSVEIRARVTPADNANATRQNEPSVDQDSTNNSSAKEPRVKRYTYAGPPAINLGSWSDRSRITKVQIKPDNDYKFEKIIATPEGERREENRPLKNDNNGNDKAANKISASGLTAVKNPQQPRVSSTNFGKEFKIDNNYCLKETRKEPDELAKTLIARTTAGGFKRPVSTSFEPLENIIRFKKESDETSRKINGEIRLDQIYGKEEVKEIKGKLKEDGEGEIDTRTRNFKELKEAFAKDQNANSSAISTPKYGTLARRSENYTTGSNKIVVRRDSNLSSNGDNENKLHRRESQGVESSRILNNSAQERRSFGVMPAAVTSSNNNINGVQDSVRKTSKVTLMPVVKGFKVPVVPEDDNSSSSFSQEKRNSSSYGRVPIGDISNGNYIPVQNGLKKTVQVNKAESFSAGAQVVPKPPTMPVITGVTLKSTTNHLKQRPKSMPATEPDTRNLLLESIRNFGGQNQLRRATGRNTNIVGSRSVRS